MKPIKPPEGWDEFVERCEDELFSCSPEQFFFPEGCSEKNWSVKKIKNGNKDLLMKLRNHANVYAIFVRQRGSKLPWEKMYVGERKSNGLRERITQHLITKDPRTGSMLEKVKKAVSSGKEVGLSFIKVEPESLRLFVEEMIILKYKTQLPWNTHG